MTTILLAGLEHHHELLLDIGVKHSSSIDPSKTQGVISRLLRRARKFGDFRQASEVQFFNDHIRDRFHRGSCRTCC